MKRIDFYCGSCGNRFEYVTPVQVCPRCERQALTLCYAPNKKPQDWQSWVATNVFSMWRYHKHLPIHDNRHIVTLGEGWTPLLKANHLGSAIGLDHLYIKDERQNPTGSFKDRQASVSISIMQEQGINDLVLASTGNAGIAYSAYAAKAKMKMRVFFPGNVHDDKVREACVYGAQVFRVNGNYHEAKIAAAQFAKEENIVLDKVIKGFASVESMKSIAFEIVEQLDGKIPDWYIQSVSGGAGPLGVTQGFSELKTLGFCQKVPALGIIQSSGCAPMVTAFKAKQSKARPFTHIQTCIPTLTTVNPGFNYELLYKLIKAHGGSMEDVSDTEAYQVTKLIAQTEGISMEPGTAVAFGGLLKLVKMGIVQRHHTVVINCSGHTRPVDKAVLGQTYVNEITPSFIQV